MPNVASEASPAIHPAATASGISSSSRAEGAHAMTTRSHHFWNRGVTSLRSFSRHAGSA